MSSSATSPPAFDAAIYVAGHRTGELAFDTSKPDGTPRKLMDVSKLAALGWSARIGLREGIAMAYADYLNSAK